MTELILKIEIARPIEVVFDFIIDPNHSPEWIDSFKEEVAAPWPPHLGTIYRNSDHKGKWTEYVVEAFKPPRHFGIMRLGGYKHHHMEYLLSEPYPGVTKLVFHVWVENFTLTDKFSLEPFEKLKAILEA